MSSSDCGCGCSGAGLCKPRRAAPRGRGRRARPNPTGVTRDPRTGTWKAAGPRPVEALLAGLSSEGVVLPLAVVEAVTRFAWRRPRLEVWGAAPAGGWEGATDYGLLRLMAPAGDLDASELRALRAAGFRVTEFALHYRIEPV